MSQPGNSPVEPQSDLPITYRPMITADRDIVLTSWVDSYLGKICAGLSSRRGQFRLAEGLLECCPVYVAASSEDPNYVLGWACTSTDCVHYVWVRPQPNWRQLGIASTLLQPYLRRSGIIYTHTPNRAWWPKKDGEVRKGFIRESFRGKVFVPEIPHGWIYNPYHAFELASRTQIYRENRSYER